MSASTTGCPICGGSNSKPILWANDPNDAANSGEPDAVVVAGFRRWNDGPRPNRLCTACGARFCSDPADQQRLDEAARGLAQRFDAAQRGDFAWFSRAAALDRVADAVIRKLRFAKRTM